MLISAIHNKKDNSYSLTIDQAALDAYNKANGTNYIALPETHYTPSGQYNDKGRCL